MTDRLITDGTAITAPMEGTMSAAKPFTHRRSFLTCAVTAPALAGPALPAQNKDYLD